MKLRETHENQKDYCGIMRLMRLIETLRDSGRLMETHETQEDFWGLIETAGSS